MKAILRSIPAALVATVIATACTDGPEPTGPQPLNLQASAVATPCGLISEMNGQVPGYFPEPERTAALGIMAALDGACSSGNDAAALGYATDLLRIIEALYNQARGGPAEVGVPLVRNLLACTRAPVCSAGTDLPAASEIDRVLTDSRGMFAIRLGQQSAPAIARAAVPVGTNSFLWGVEVAEGSNWFDAKKQKSPVAFIYGWPIGEAAPLPGVTDTSLGSRYELRHWPDTDGFVDGLISVGICGLPSQAIIEPAGTTTRMQRNSTLLELTTPRFCNPGEDSDAPQSGMLVQSAGDGAHADQWITAYRTIVRSPVVGGSPLDFSVFLAVAARTDGRLHAEWTIPARPSTSTPIRVRVTALSGGNTPIERVPVRVFILRNRGEPAGAVLNGGLQSGETDEASGSVELGGFSMGKPGGYTLCVEVPQGEFAGFTFTTACSPLFNVRK